MLITSRTAAWDGDDFTCYAVDALDTATERSAGVEVLWQAAGDNAARADGRAGARALAEALGGLPLALVCAGAWLRDTPTTSFAEYGRRLEEVIHLKPATVEDYPDSVFGAVKLSLDRLGSDAALPMKVFAFLGPDDFWSGLVTALDAKRAEFEAGDEHWRPVPDELWALARDRAAVERAFAELERRSLVERGDDWGGEPSWRVHRLTQAVQRAIAAQQRDAPNWRASAAAVVAAAYPHNVELRENWPLCARLGPHVEALAKDPPPTREMEQIFSFASTYLDRQRLDVRALDFAKQHLRLKGARLGPTHPALGTAHHSLSIRLQRVGRLGMAEMSAAQAVALLRNAPPEYQEHFAAALSSLGTVRNDTGRKLKGLERAAKLKAAALCFQEAREILLIMPGEHTRGLCVVTHNLAELRGSEGLWDEALRLHGDVLELRLAPATDALDLAWSRLNLGSMLLFSGRSRAGWVGEGTLDLLEAALTIREAAFDRPEHRDRVEAAEALACAHLALAELGQPLEGRVLPDPSRAMGLCDSYALDSERMKVHAKQHVERARMFEAGQVVPPVRGRGQ